jgi:ribosomal protein S18 acetylase RimI-like enzyme
MTPAVSASSLRVRDISDVHELGTLRPLWLDLHHHHRVVGPCQLLVDDDAASWERRRAVYEEWMRAGGAIVLIADLPPGETVGYLVARVCEGPDDTFAVADRYAELYSLCVAPARRGQGIGTALLDALDARLDALGVRDLTVAVMVGNDDALRLYRARGLTPAEVTLWRLGGSKAG